MNHNLSDTLNFNDSDNINGFEIIKKGWVKDVDIFLLII